MNDYLRYARQADLALAVVFGLLSLFTAWKADWLWTGIWASSAVVSFASAKLQPARWVLRRVLGLGFVR